jgi:broad specificity phosphatase PhoE
MSPPTIETSNQYAVTSSSIPEEPQEGTCKIFTLYLIRHGEAAHNVLEKAAKKDALEKAIADGFDKDSDEAKHRMEEARKGVLNDITLFDAPLSDLGCEEATQACSKLADLLQSLNLKPPAEILVSPLQRALQTADLIFPESASIRVREELRERCTGLPPDSRASSATLSRQATFQRFSMFRLRMQSIAKMDLPMFNHLFRDEEDEVELDSISDFCSTEEDKVMLRTRTKTLFKLLAESDERSIAIVTHKGFLRELERGPFAQVDATEFKNCEVRVYKVKITKDKDLESADRMV